MSLTTLTPGSLVTPGHARWDELAAGGDPAFVAVPRTAEDLRTILAFVREHDLRIGAGDGEVRLRADALQAEPGVRVVTRDARLRRVAARAGLPAGTVVVPVGA